DVDDGAIAVVAQPIESLQRWLQARGDAVAHHGKLCDAGWQGRGWRRWFLRGCGGVWRLGRRLGRLPREVGRGPAARVAGGAGGASGDGRQDGSGGDGGG